MKRPTITLEEFITMSIEELDAFIERDRWLIAQGLVSEDDPTVDMMGMTIEQIADKYHYYTIDEVRDNIVRKLSDR